MEGTTNSRILARCPECGTQYQLHQKHLGHKVKCRNGHVFTLTAENAQPLREPEPAIILQAVEPSVEPPGQPQPNGRKTTLTRNKLVLAICLGAAFLVAFMAFRSFGSQGSATAAFWNDLWKHSSEESKAQDLPQLIAELSRELEKDRAKVRKAESDGVDPLALHLGTQYLRAGDAILEWFHHVNWMQENWIRVEAGKLTGGDAIPKFGRLTSAVSANLGDLNAAAPAVYNDLRRKYPSQSFLSPSAIDPAPFQAAYQAAQQDEQTLQEAVKTGFAIGLAVGANMAGSE